MYIQLSDNVGRFLIYCLLKYSSPIGYIEIILFYLLMMVNTRINQTNHIEIIYENTLICSYHCNFSDILQSFSENLIQQGSGENKYSCNKCGKKYSSVGNLNRHTSLHCGKEPTFYCQFCSYRAFQKVHLQSHILRRHPQSLNFSSME